MDNPYLDTDSEGSFTSSPRFGERPYSAGGFVADMAGFGSGGLASDRYIGSDTFGLEEEEDDPYNFQFKPKTKKKKKKKQRETSEQEKKRLEREAQWKKLLDQQFTNFSEEEDADEGEANGEQSEASTSLAEKPEVPKEDEQPMEMEEFEDSDSLSMSESDFRVGGYTKSSANVDADEEFASAGAGTPRNPSAEESVTPSSGVANPSEFESNPTQDGEGLLLSESRTGDEPPQRHHFEESLASGTSQSADNADDILAGYSDDYGTQQEESLFQDGSDDGTTELDETSGSLGMPSLKPFQAGDRIKAKIMGWKQHYAGTVSVANHDGTYQVIFDDGEVSQNVHPSDMIPEAKESNSEKTHSANGPKLLEIGMRVKAKMSDWKQAYEGEIMSVHRLDNTYKIRFNDGEVVDNVERQQITSMVSLESADFQTKSGVDEHHFTTSQSLETASATSPNDTLVNNPPAEIGLGESTESAPSRKLAPTYQVDDRIEARVLDWKQYHSGIVVSVNSDKTYSILFDDGERIDQVTLEQIRLPVDHDESTLEQLGSSGNEELINQQEVERNFRENVDGGSERSKELEYQEDSVTAAARAEDSITARDQPLPMDTEPQTPPKHTEYTLENENQREITTNAKLTVDTSPLDISNKDNSHESSVQEPAFQSKLKLIKRNSPKETVVASPPRSTKLRTPRKVASLYNQQSRIGSPSKLAKDYNRLKLEVGALKREIQEVQESSAIALDAERRESDLLRGLLETRDAEIAGLKARLKELESVAQLRESLRQVAEAAGARGRPAKGTTAPAVGGKEPSLRDSSEIGPELLLQIEREMAAQERLLSGYQKENERLLEQLKEAEKRTEESSKALFRENVRLGKEVNALDNLQRSRGLSMSQLGGGGVFAPPPPLPEEPRVIQSLPLEEPVMQRDLESGGNQAELLRSRLNAETVIHELREELEETRRRSNLRMKELKAELDQSRATNKELECKLAGFDSLDQFNADVAQQTEAVEKLRRDLEDARAEHAREAKALKEKLSWYTENQELLSENDSIIREQRDLIVQLHEALRESNSQWKPKTKVQSNVLRNAKSSAPRDSSSAPEPRPDDRKKGIRSLPSDLKKIRALEHQVSELTEALRKRNPDCIANLIAAAGPTEEQKETMAMLQEKVRFLEGNLKQREADHERVIRALRQDYEKLKLRNIRLQEAKASSHLAGHAGVKKDSAPRIHALEEELQRVREFYRKKMESISRKSDVSGRDASQQEDPSLQRTVDRLRATNVALLARVQEMEGSLLGKQVPDSDTVSQSDQVVAKLKRENQVLVGKLRKATTAAKGYPRQAWNHGGKPGEKETPPLDLLGAIEVAEHADEERRSASSESGDGNYKLMEELKEKNREIETLKQELKRNGKVHLPTDSNENPAMDESSTDLSRMQKELFEKLSGEFNLRLANLESKATQKQQVSDRHWERALERSEEEALRLKELNMELNSRLEVAERELRTPKTPSMLQQLTLTKRIEALESKLKLREQELNRIVSQVRGTSELDLQLMKQNYELKLEHKDAQLRKFRDELLNIMDAISGANKKD